MNRIASVFKGIPIKPLAAVLLMLIGGALTQVTVIPEIGKATINLGLLGLFLAGFGFYLFISYIWVTLVILGSIIVLAVVFAGWPMSNLVIAAIVIGTGLWLNRR